MRLSTDDLVLWHQGFVQLNATIIYTWGLMLVLVVGARLITRRLTTGISVSRGQSALEIIVRNLKKEIDEAQNKLQFILKSVEKTLNADK